MALIDNLIASRKRSIAMLDERVAQLEVLASKAPVGPARLAIESQQKIAMQRKVRLLEELAGFQATANASQPSLPLDLPKKR